MSRTCRDANVAAVSIFHANFTSGPISSFTSASKGILVAADLSTGTRQISPPYDTTTDFESGMKLKPGYASIDARDSVSSRCTGKASQSSCCVSRLRMRSPVFVSKRVPYTKYLPSGDSVGRKPEPKRVDICDTRPVSLSHTYS